MTTYQVTFEFKSDQPPRHEHGVYFSSVPIVKLRPRTADEVTALMTALHGDPLLQKPFKMWRVMEDIAPLLDDKELALVSWPIMKEAEVRVDRIDD